MPSVLTVTIFVYAVLLGVFGAALWAIAAVGGFAVLWQMASTIYAGVLPSQKPPEEPAPPLYPVEDPLTPEERILLDLPAEEDLT